MNFFASKHENVFMLYITNESFDDRRILLDELREYFGAWMFLGVREYSKDDFLQQFANYIPSYVVEQIESNPTAFTYKAELRIKK